VNPTTSRRSATPSIPVFLALAALAACRVPVDLEGDYPSPEPRPALSDAPFRLEVGDLIDAEFCRRFAPIESYVLGNGDRIDITVHQHDELAASTIVAPDGTITFHRLGTVEAEGLSVEELRAKLEEELLEFIPDPQVSIFLVDVDVRTERFVEMMLRNPNGASRSVRVSPEGRISLPGVGPVDVLGLGLIEAEEEINTRLQENFPGLQVVLNPSEITKNVFSVLGEVLQPGVFTFQGETSLFEAIARAGGRTPYSDLNQVIVMSRTTDGIDARLYSFEDSVLHGDPLYDVRIQPRDTIYVVERGVRNTNEWVEQFIRLNIPVTIGVGASYRLND